MAELRSHATSKASLSSEMTLAGLQAGLDLTDVGPKLADEEEGGVLPSESEVPPLSDARKTLLLAIFALSVFIDVISLSAFFVFTSEITQDLGIVFAQQSWVISSCSVTFASFLLFWGRVCDLYSVKSVFVSGFFVVGIANFVLSFLTDRYAFFIIRALTGIAGASLVPTAYRLIGNVFPPAERGRAYTLYTMTGSIANVLGTVIAGVIDLIPTHEQMRSWRWFFRIVAAITIPSAMAAFFLIPGDLKRPTASLTKKEKLRMLDPIGILSILIAVILLILGLTLGASYGWKKPAFLVPFLLCIFLFPFFFWWESRLPEKEALLPSSIWAIPNITVLLAFALITYGWWTVNFIPFIELFHTVHEEPMILAAVRTLPEGIIAAIVSVVLVKYPGLIARPRIPIICAMLLSAAAYVLWTQTPSVVGIDYWRFVLPGMLIGSGGMQGVLLATNVGVMLAAPPDRTGVVGAALQMSQQTSTVIALSIQAGLLTVRPGGLANFADVRASWYFELGWTVVWLIGFVSFYRPSKSPKSIDGGVPMTH